MMENKRIIKFRGWDGEKMGRVVIGVNGKAYRDIDAYMNLEYFEGPVLQFTGLYDLNGKEIYEGDIIRWFTLDIEWQTHYGDNIPLGQYTEPCGITSSKFEKPVRFIDAKFTCQDFEDEDGEVGAPDCPFHFKNMYDRLDLNHIFFPRPGGRENEVLSDEEFLEVAQEIGKELGFAVETINGFIETINSVEVVGNIYENPELLAV